MPAAAFKTLRSWGKEERRVLGVRPLRFGLAVAGLVLLPLVALLGRARLQETKESLGTERREPLAVLLSSLTAASRVARDWGQWDHMRDYVRQLDHSVLSNAIEPTSVLEIGRVMAVVHESGRVLFIRGGDGDLADLHRSLLTCARPNLTVLRAVNQVQLLACRDGAGRDFLGAATRVTDSAKTVVSPAVLVFFLPLHHLELGPAINAQVRRLAKDFVWVSAAPVPGASAPALPARLEPLGFPAPVYGTGGQQLVLRQPSAQGPALKLLGRDLALAALVLATLLGLRLVLMLQRRRSRLVQRQVERRGNSRVRQLGAELEALLDGTGITPLAATRSDRVLARLMRSPATAAPATGGDQQAVAGFEQRIQRLASRFQEVLERAWSLALLDPLTGLPNRRYFIEHLQLQLEHWRGLAAAADSAGAGAKPARGSAGGVPFAVVLIDIDRFKIINDSYGHRTGDAVLKAVALRLQQLITPADFLARYGADELAIWVDLSGEDDPSPQGLLRALQLRADALAGAFRTPLNLEVLDLTVSISLGVHLLATAQDDGSEALKCANLAMVRAKAKRHSAVVVFDPEQDVSDLTSYQFYLELIEAIRGDDDQLQVLFQPIFGTSGQVRAVEALARWTHPTRGLISPDTFLALAEQHRAMAPLGEALLRLTLEGFAPIHRRNPDIRLALNLHPTQLSEVSLVRRLTDRLDQVGIAAACLTVELTEQALLEPEPAVSANLELLRQNGIALSLDDFGTGYSSLVLVGSLRPDEVKIDRSFSQAMLTNAYAAQTVSLIASMASSLDLALVAEGVDSAEVLQALMALGVRRFQGFLLARPMRAAELIERLDGRGFDFPVASALAQVSQG